METCKDTYGQYSYYTWRIENWIYICDCISWYDFWWTYWNTCIKQKTWLDICKDTYGQYSYYTWKIENWKYICDCISWYDFWWTNWNMCILIKRKTYSSENIIKKEVETELKCDEVMAALGICEIK